MAVHYIQGIQQYIIIYDGLLLYKVHYSTILNKVHNSTLLYKIHDSTLLYKVHNSTLLYKVHYSILFYITLRFRTACTRFMTDHIVHQDSGHHRTWSEYIVFPGL